MLKKILNSFFKKSVEQPETNYIIAQLNDKIMPLGRGEVYEDPLDEFLKQKGYGEITGGGTLQSQTGEIKYCDIEIKLPGKVIDRVILFDIIKQIESFGAPKGSKLLIENTKEEIAFGKLEGFGIYLDGVNLSDEVYKNSDPAALATEIRRLANIKSNEPRFWEGNTETALYFYGDSFEMMKNSIINFINTHPECENAKIQKIA